MVDGGEPRRKLPATVVLRSAGKHTSLRQVSSSSLMFTADSTKNQLSATYNFLVVSTASHTGLMMLEESPLEDFKHPEACRRGKV